MIISHFTPNYSYLSFNIVTVPVVEREERQGKGKKESRRNYRLKRRIKACPHLFPKQETLYPETGDFVAVSGDFFVRNGKFVSGNRRLCIRKQVTLLPFLTTKSTTKSSVSGYKVSCFGKKCGQAFTEHSGLNATTKPVKVLYN